MALLADEPFLRIVLQVSAELEAPGGQGHGHEHVPELVVPSWTP